MDYKKGPDVEKDRLKSLLKSTEEVRKAFDILGCQDSFLDGSQLILEFVSSRLSACEGDNELSTEVKYVLKRLISGLSTSREFMRHGCYATLHTLLVRHRECLSFTIHYMNEFHLKNQNEKGSEYKIGRIMVLGAIIRSGCVSEDFSLAKDIIEMLLALKGGKVSTDFLVGQFLVHHLISYKSKNLSEFIWDETKDEIQKDVTTLHPSMLWVRLIFSRKEYLNHLPGADLNFQYETFSESSLNYIVTTMKDMSKENMDVSLFAKDLMVTLSSVGDGNNVLDIGMFFQNSIQPLLDSLSPKTLTFIYNITQTALPYVTCEKDVKGVLSIKLLETLTHSQQLLNSEQVNSSVQSLLGVILDQVMKREEETDSDIQFAYVSQLISTSHGLEFDEVSGTTLVQQLIPHLNVRTLQNLSTLLNELMTKDGKEVKTGSKALSAMEILSRIVCHPKMILGLEYLDWRARQTVQIIHFAFFQPHLHGNQNHLVKFYFRTLNHLPKRIHHQVMLMTKIFDELSILLKTSSGSCTISKESRKRLKNCVARMTKISALYLPVKKDCNNLIFQLLYGHASLCLLANTDYAHELQDKVDFCYNAVYEGDRLKKQNKNELDELLIDLLLFILSKEENYWRKVVVSIFRYMCSSVAPSSLRLITDAIHTEEGEMKESESDFDDEEVEEIDGEKTCDMLGEDSEEGHEDSEGDEDDSDSDEDDSEEDEEEESLGDVQKAEMMKLRMQMQTLVGVPSEDDIPLDSVPEEELMNLDRNLGALVGQFINIRRQTKKERKRIKETEIKDETALMHFRLRVCDLLESIVTEVPSMMHLVFITRPIFLALEAAASKSKKEQQKSLTQRLRSILLDLCKVKKFTSVDDSVSFTDLIKELEELSLLNKKACRNKLSKEYGYCWTFLLRCGLSLCPNGSIDSSSPLKLFHLYADLVEFSLKKDGCMVSGPLHLDSEHLSLVLDKLLSLTFIESVKPFKRKQGLEMILTILSNRTAMARMPDTFVQELHSRLSQSLIESYSNVKTTGGKFQSMYLVAVNTFLKSLKQLHRDKPQWESWFDWDGIASALKVFSSKVSLRKFKPLRASITGVSKVLGLDIVLPRNKPKEKSKENSSKINHNVVETSSLTVQLEPMNELAELNLDADSEEEIESSHSDYEAKQAQKLLKLKKEEKRLRKEERKKRKRESSKLLHEESSSSRVDQPTSSVKKKKTKAKSRLKRIERIQATLGSENDNQLSSFHFVPDSLIS